MKQEDLRSAYTQAVYRVDVEPEPIFLQVGELTPALDRWLTEHGASSFAFVSAANPGSVALPEVENARRHQQLIERLRASGNRVLPGESYEAVSGGWRESSLLVAGVEREAAIALAREFGQAALLIGEVGGPVELLFTGGPKG